VIPNQAMERTPKTFGAAHLILVRLATSIGTSKLRPRKMKTPTLIAASVAIVIMAAPFESKGKEPEFKPPGTEENAAVDQANTKLDAVYKRLMGKLDADGQKALKDAERSWIKWRDDEAMLMARVGGSVGGSALRMDFANAQKKLIDQRIEVLSEYMGKVESGK
jgi:uncharacterized protein YecT (DUF1311 family)